MQFDVAVVEAVQRVLKLMNLKFNAKQCEHFSVSLRTYGIGQMAAFGYAAVQVGYWFVGAVSFVALLLCEAASLWFLKDVENSDGE